MNFRHVIGATAIAIVMAASGAANAATETFDYTGTALTYSVNAPALGTNAITGSVTFDSTATSNFTGYVSGSHIISANLTNGTISAATPSGIFDFYFQNGQITTWELQLYDFAAQTILETSGGTTATAEDIVYSYAIGAGNSSITAGTWTQVSAVPLPAALPLFGAALFGLGGLGLRKRKAAQAA